MGKGRIFQFVYPKNGRYFLMARAGPISIKSRMLELAPFACQLWGVGWAASRRETGVFFFFA